MRPDATSGLKRTYLKLRLYSVTAFRGPFVIELFWGLAYMATMVVFWEVIFSEVITIEEWTHGGVLLFMYFLELFWGISRSLLAVTRYFWTLINRGSIDVFLCRPVNVRIAMLLHGCELTVLARSLLISVFWLVLAVRAGVHVSASDMLLGHVVAILGLAAYAFFSLSINFLAFWWGKTQALDELLGGFWDVLRYPLDLLPRLAVAALATLVPAALAATAPAMVATGQLAALPALAGCTLVAGAWMAAQELLWRKGLQRYESFGG